MVDQTKIWSYFQGAGVSSFDGAVPRLRYLLRRARSLGGAGASVLNIGAGSGWLEMNAARLGLRIRSLDLDAATVARLQQAGIESKQGRIEALPWESSSCDGVIASEIFEHLSPEQLAAGAAEIARVLRPMGFLIGTVPFDEDLASSQVVCLHCGSLFHRWGHLQSFNQQRLHAALSDAFVRVSVRTAAFWGWRMHPHWSRKIGSMLKSAANAGLRRVGVHNENENLIFVYRRKDAAQAGVRRV